MAMPNVKIFLLCIVASCVFGIVHDQITVRICLEYFTVGHAGTFNTDNPTALGFLFGVSATWWVGAILGLVLAVTSTGGALPSLNWRELAKPVALAMLFCFAAAALAGLLAWVLARTGMVSLSDDWAQILPPSRQLPFLICLWTHTASYLAGLVGGIALCFKARRMRFERQQGHCTTV